MEGNSNFKNKIFVIGIDAATFDVIFPLIKGGKLPNLYSIIKEGSYGELSSTIPPLSPVAWTSFMTGVNPGKHAITDVLLRKPGGYSLVFANTTYRRSKPIWSILHEFERKVCIINVPLTYPPDKVNGCMITGMLTPFGVTDFGYPQTLIREIESKFGDYTLEINARQGKDKLLQSVYHLIEYQESVTKYLMGKYYWDLFVVVFTAVDRVQHFFWQYMDKNHPRYCEKDAKKYRHAIFDTYQKVDATIGHLINEIKDETTIVILSDHGAGPVYKAFSLVDWLCEKGYLYLKDMQGINRRRGVHTTQLYKSFVKRVLPKRIINALKRRREDTNKQIELTHLFSNINWSQTRAFSEGAGGGIFINVKGREPEGIVNRFDEYESLRAEIIAELEKLIDPHSGARVIKKIYKREEIYSGEYLALAPDLVVICEKGYNIMSPSESLKLGVKKDKRLFFPHIWSGKHEENGIICLKGLGIKKGFKLTDAKIIDIVPTILYLMGYPLVRDFDGTVLVDAIEESFLKSNPVRYTEAYKIGIPSENGKTFSEENSRDIKDKLENLGYL